MFAILETGGKQYKVAEGDILDIELLDPEIIKKNHVTLETVLLIQDDKGTHVGDPYVKNGRVKAKLVEEIKDEKIIIFKKKSKKQYKRKTGHRQKLHRIEVEKIEIKAPAKAKDTGTDAKESE
jgi:large subunit ribosomal protein L21